MEHGDHVKIIGRDGLYVFLKEVQGMATLRVAIPKGPDELSLSIPMNHVVSLEQANMTCPHPSRS